MNYTYHTDCHELWACAATMPSPPFPIRLRNLSNYAVEKAFVISNQENLHAPTVILPDLSAHLVIHHLSDGSLSGCLIGPRTQALLINRQKRRKTYLLRFEAGALAQYLSFPVQDLTDRSIPLEHLVTSEREAIFSETFKHVSPNPIFSKMLLLLESLRGEQKASDQLIVRRFLQEESRKNELRTVRSVARNIGLSERYLQRIIKAQTGLSPKMALRILRLRQSLILRQNDQRNSWSGIASQSGYFDQSHMIDEYQRLLGSSPNRLFYGSTGLQLA